MGYASDGGNGAARVMDTGTAAPRVRGAVAPRELCLALTVNAGAAYQKTAVAQRQALRTVIDHSKPRQSGFGSSRTVGATVYELRLVI